VERLFRHRAQGRTPLYRPGRRPRAWCRRR
jgi:hypothetical protein